MSKYQGRFSNPRESEPVAAGEQSAVMVQEPKKAKKSKKGTILFYSIYGGLTACLLAAILLMLIPLHNWLEKYEASQPETKSAEVFAQLFENPDWEVLYEQAGMTDTAFEGKEEFAVYMENKVGSDALTYMETAAGLSGDRKYVVRHGDEKVASYTLTGGSDNQAEIVTWSLGQVELFVTRDCSVTVEKLPGQTVYINGVALDDSYTIRKMSTKAEDYLPEGVHGYRTEQQCVEGLLAQPTVEVKDADGQVVPVVVAEDGTVSVELTPMEISQQDKERAIDAAKSSALFAIRAIGSYDLRRYYDAESQIYRDTCETVAFMQDYNGYTFVNSATEVRDCYRYSEDMFSCNVVLQLNVTRTDGTVKEYHSDVTYFFTKLSDGQYYVTDSTNIRVQDVVEQVRFIFSTDAGDDVRFVDAASKTLFLPQITAPEGQVLTGWAVREDNVLKVVFTPAEDGIVYITSEEPLEPMTLYPVFSKEN